MNAFLLRLLRRQSRWVWEEELTKGAEAVEELAGAKRYAHVLALQLTILQDLFGEKQAKIGRLQDAYNAKRGPKYEDLRKENPITTAESLIQSMDVMTAHAARVLERTGKRWPHSDGTVQGVPGDKPNDEQAEWR